MQGAANKKAITPAPGGSRLYLYIMQQDIRKLIEQLFAQKEARIAELQAENERLSRELARLRAANESAPDWVRDPETHPDYPFK